MPLKCGNSHQSQYNSKSPNDSLCYGTGHEDWVYYGHENPVRCLQTRAVLKAAHSGCTNCCTPPRLYTAAGHTAGCCIVLQHSCTGLRHAAALTACCTSYPCPPHTPGQSATTALSSGHATSPLSRASSCCTQAQQSSDLCMHASTCAAAAGG